MKTLKKSTSILISLAVILIVIAAFFFVNAQAIAEEEPTAEPPAEEVTEETAESGTFLDTIKEQFDLNAILATVSSVVSVGSIASVVAFILKLIKTRKSLTANTASVTALSNHLDEITAKVQEVDTKLMQAQEALTLEVAKNREYEQRIINYHLYLASKSNLTDADKALLEKILDGKISEVNNDEQAEG